MLETRQLVGILYLEIRLDLGHGSGRRESSDQDNRAGVV